MNINFCPCLPCNAQYALSESPIPLNHHITTYLFNFLERTDLAQASLVCKNWRILAAKLGPHAGQCLYARRHVIAIDVSGSMGSALDPSSEAAKARIIAYNIAENLEPVIKRIGIFVGKFATGKQLKHFRTLPSAKPYITQSSDELGGNTDFSSFLTLCLSRFKAMENKNKTRRELVIHLVTDLEMTRHSFNEILDKAKLKSFPSRVSLVCYVTTPSENPLKKSLLDEYSLKGLVAEDINENGKKRSLYKDFAHVGFAAAETVQTLKKQRIDVEENKDEMMN